MKLEKLEKLQILNGLILEFEEIQNLYLGVGDDVLANIKAKAGSIKDQLKSLYEYGVKQGFDIGFESAAYNLLNSAREALYDQEVKSLLSSTPEGKNLWEKIVNFFSKLFIKNEGEKLLDRAKDLCSDIKKDMDVEKKLANAKVGLTLFDHVANLFDKGDRVSEKEGPSPYRFELK